MEYLFVFINDGWWLKIKSIDELLNYHKQTVSRWSNALISYIQQGEKSQDPLVQTILLKADGTKTAIQLIDEIRSKIAVTQLHKLQDNSYIHINIAGGYCTTFKESDEQQWVRRKNLVFPNFKTSDIKIKRFPNGTHYYAYIGDVELHDGDISKWNDSDTAYTFAKEFIEC